MDASNAQAAYQFFLSKGYQPHQAAALVGNFQQESGQGLSTGALGDHGTAYGIAQWRGDRLDGPQGLRGWAQGQSLDPSQLNTQLQFADWELRNREQTAFSRLQNAKDVTQATNAAIGYERPQGWSFDNPANGAGYGNRLGYAQGLLGGGQAVASGTGQPPVQDTGTPAPPAPTPAAPAQASPMQMAQGFMGQQQAQQQKSQQAMSQLEQEAAQYRQNNINRPRGLLG